MALDEPAPDIDLPTERPLFSPPWKPKIADQILVEGAAEFSADALYEQVYVDKAELASRIRKALQMQTQVSLGELLSVHPLERGLAEIVAYLSLAADDSHAIIEDEQRQSISWTDPSGNERHATVPLVVFSR